MRSRNCLLLTVLAATALLGWPGQAAAIPVFYNLNGTINFIIIPNPPPHPPVSMVINASFRYDAATNTESDVIIDLLDLTEGNLIEQRYRQLGPLVTDGHEIVATGIKFGNKLTFLFAHNFDGTANDLDFTLIEAPIVDASPHNPCGPYPRVCFADRDHVSGTAVPGLGGTEIPEPSSLSVFGLIGIIMGGMSLMSRSVNRRRVGQRSSETVEC